MDYHEFTNFTINKLSKGTIWDKLSMEDEIEIEVQWDMFQAILLTRQSLVEPILSARDFDSSNAKIIFTNYARQLQASHGYIAPRKSRSKYHVVDLSCHIEALEKLCAIINVFGVFERQLAPESLLCLLNGDKRETFKCESNVKFAFVMGTLSKYGFLQRNWQSMVEKNNNIISSNKETPLYASLCRSYWNKSLKCIDFEEPRYNEAYEAFDKQICNVSKSLTHNK